MIAYLWIWQKGRRVAGALACVQSVLDMLAGVGSVFGVLSER